MKTMEKAINVSLLEVTSPAFKSGELIPVQYTCDGVNMSPPIQVTGIPEDAACLAIIFNDPDAPIGTWVHWLVWNISPQKNIAQNKIDGVEGLNDFQQHHYGGPCPPSGTHRYVLKVYALDQMLDLSADTRQHKLEKAMSGHIIGYGELIGYYKKSTLGRP